MKLLFWPLLCLLSSMALAGPEAVVTATAESGDLEVQVENIASGAGTIRIAVYQYQEGRNWQAEPVQYGEIVDLQPGKPVSFIFRSLVFGSYAIKLFHDLNGNKSIDVDESGLPLEPFAFSQEPGQKSRVLGLNDAMIAFLRPNQRVVLPLVQITPNP